MSSHQLDFKTNDIVLLLKTIKVLKLFPVACRYGWHGWKLEKTGQFFRVLMLRVPKILETLVMVNPLHREHTILLGKERVNKGTKKKLTVYLCLLLSSILSYAILLAKPLLANPATLRQNTFERALDDVFEI